MSDDPASGDGMRWTIRQSLVERLRIRWDAMGDMANQQRYEASVQISLMMDELEGWKAAMQKAERDISELRDALEVEESAVNHLHTDRNNLRLEIDRMVEKLTAERDEARRSVCEMSIQLGGVYRRVGGKTVEVTTPEGCAEIMRWDCFKENTND